MLCVKPEVGIQHGQIKVTLVSNIDEYGDFLVVSENFQMNALVSKLNELLTRDPKRTLKELLELTTTKQWKVREALKSSGWAKSKTSDVWVRGIPANEQPVVRAPQALRPPSPESQVNAVSFD